MSEFFTTYGKDIVIVVVTLSVFALFTWGYFHLAHPTIVLTKMGGAVNQCPDLWIFKDGECSPSYQTKCKPFNPDLYKGKECDIAKSCGTSWKGLCK